MSKFDKSEETKQNQNSETVENSTEQGKKTARAVPVSQRPKADPNKDVSREKQDAADQAAVPDSNASETVSGSSSAVPESSASGDSVENSGNSETEKIAVRTRQVSGGKTPREKQVRNRKLILIGIVIVVAILLVMGILLLTGFGESKEMSDYASHYGLTEDDQIVVVINNETLEETGLRVDMEGYVAYDTVQTYLDDRYYWDDTEQILRYTTPDSIVQTTLDTEDYTVNGEDYQMGYPIVLSENDQIYLSLTFMEQFTDFRWESYADPDRAVISTQWGDVEFTQVKRDTEVRELGGIKSPILTELSKGDEVTVIEEMDKWAEVCTQDGFQGYVRIRDLGDTVTETYTSDFTEPVYTHNLLDEPVCLGWHQVTNASTNNYVGDVVTGDTCMNVISPTWFYLNDNEGGIQSYASSGYVSYCHERGIQVWALVSNLENPDVDTGEVLNVTSHRDALINNLIQQAVQYGFDGINVDFEALSDDEGPGYLEMIRELSVQCKANDLILSVDNYVPSAYTEMYDRAEEALYADYVIVMAYDEHFAGSEEAGSVASISFVEQGIADTLEEVPAEQVIQGIPLYTRLWKQTPADSENYELSSEAMGMSSATDLVTKYNLTPEWDEETGQYYAEYDDGGSTYKIWFETAKSIDLKLQVMKKNNLAGAAFWKLGFEKSELWSTIGEYYE